MYFVLEVVVCCGKFFTLRYFDCWKILKKIEKENLTLVRGFHFHVAPVAPVAQK